MSEENARIVRAIFIWVLLFWFVLVVPLVAISYFGELTGQWVTVLIVGFYFGINTNRLMQ